jgi:TPR repeat protein
MKTITAILTALLISIGFASAVSAGDFEDGVAAFDEGNYEAAFTAYRKAAEQGDVDAQFNLAAMYDEGKGVPQDYKQAVNWYRKAAEQGDAYAQFNLGLMYAKGQGVPQDYVHAHKWFNLSAVGGGKDAVKNRDTAAGLMTPAQIAEAQKLAREWKPSSP